ncbi:MAG: hypothetical protein IPK52_22445 [Chloroflexi bacterium]|nr:hypothetical protein [Chloroflexota bacterium]
MFEERRTGLRAASLPPRIGVTAFSLVALAVQWQGAASRYPGMTGATPRRFWRWRPSARSS